MKYTIEMIKQDFKKGKSIKYLFFWGHQKSENNMITKSSFSQWWSVNFIIDNMEYSCMEQYMMAEKARLFMDNDTLKKIMDTDDPKKIKALGRQVKNYDDSIWKQHRYYIVLKGNLAKFSQNEDLKEFLLKTKDKVIVEASPYDKVWGVGMPADEKLIENPLYWKGENLLGFALMEVRDILAE